MPNLGDFLGCLLGEMATARLHADVESLRIAEVYAGDELLKHFPVPRFRLPEVRLDVPVIVERDEDGVAEAGRIKPDAAYEAFVAALGDHVDRRVVRIDDSTKRKATIWLERELRAATQPPAQRIARTVLDILEASLSGERARDEFRKVRASLEKDFGQRLIVARARASRIRVVLTTAAVSEVSEPDRLVQLHISLSEDAMVWTMIDTAEGEKDRLVPE